MNVKSIASEAEFEQLLSSESKFLVDFYATWCGPCKAQEPELAEFAGKWSGTVVKVDIDSQRDIAKKFKVRSVPTLVYFNAGSEEKRFIGVQTAADLQQQLG